VISVDLVNAIYHHARINERAIGVDFDSEKVTAVYGLLEELTLEDAAKKSLRVELVLQLDEIQKSIQSAKSSGSEFDSVMRIAKTSELAIAMMEAIDG
jgi:uncharacterized protein YueI